MRNEERQYKFPRPLSNCGKIRGCEGIYWRGRKREGVEGPRYRFCEGVYFPPREGASFGGVSSVWLAAQHPTPAASSSRIPRLQSPHRRHVAIFYFRFSRAARSSSSHTIPRRFPDDQSFQRSLFPAVSVSSACLRQPDPEPTAAVRIRGVTWTIPPCRRPVPLGLLDIFSSHPRGAARFIRAFERGRCREGYRRPPEGSARGRRLPPRITGGKGRTVCRRHYRQLLF